MPSKEIRWLLRENEEYNRMLEEYDERREFPLDKVRRSFTLKKRAYWRLKSEAERKGTSMSALIEGLVENLA
jgi:predicted DNA-binding ribbon-helix-helix protein